MKCEMRTRFWSANTQERSRKKIQVFSVWGHKKNYRSNVWNGFIRFIKFIRFLKFVRFITGCREGLLLFYLLYDFSVTHCPRVPCRFIFLTAE